MKVYNSLHVQIQYSIYLRCRCGSGQNPRTDVDEIFGDPHLSGHYACSLGGPHHGCGPNRVDGIYDVTIARHQTLRSHPHTCLAYINQAKQIFIVPYWNVIIIRYWIGTEPQNCINWSVLDRTDPLFPGSFEHYCKLHICVHTGI